jgi:integrase
MITDKQIQKAMREAPASGKGSIELKDPGERGAGRLAIVIRPMAGRVAAEWYAVYYRGGKRVTAKLGSYPTMPVVEARAKFQTDYAPGISSGENPSAKLRKVSARGTVSELFTAYVEHLEARGARSAGLVKFLLLSPTSGMAKSIGAGRQAGSVTPDEIVPHLAKIHGRGAKVHANVVRSYTSAAYNFGMRSEHSFTRANTDVRWGIKVNPVTAIPADMSAGRVGDRFLSPVEFRIVWLWLADYQSESLIASAIMLKMATGQRSEEVLRISESGYDRQKAMATWEKTKNGLPHSIPLPHQATAILDTLPSNGHGWFFPRQGKPTMPAGHPSISKVIVKFLTQHPDFARFNARDLRRTWKTLAGDAGIPKEMRDRLQNHAQRGDVSSRHYDRYDYLPERRAAMAKWAAYLDLVIAGKVDEIGGAIDNVVPMRKA